MTPISKFEQVLESVETLSIEEQEALIDLVRQRLKERRRTEIAENIARSQQDDRAGKVFCGTVEQIIAELNRPLA
ncbi:hypothetical protein IQ238_15160 [Pleurocapsales cyanobacterium LEGE 06147]|nr:hypothetical protein [Pleurocapsales cyanobacterium LEGE 06147]